MNNKLLNIAYRELKSKKYDAYYLSLSNEHLYEFTRNVDNFIVELTGFTGDTAALLITSNKTYLYVDGRFTIQARNEVKDKSIKVVETSSHKDRCEDIAKRLKKNAKLVINPKIESIKNVLYMKSFFKSLDIGFDYDFLLKYFKDSKKNCFDLKSAPLFMLDNRYVSLPFYKKINEIKEKIREDNDVPYNFTYITSNLEEIAYLTNLRYKLCDIDNRGVLFDAFLMINNKKSFLYLKDYLSEKDIKLFNKHNVIIKQYNDFYKDLKVIRNNKKVFIDKRINNFYIYKCLRLNNEKQFIYSPLEKLMSMKGELEIKNIRKANIIDGIAMAKIIYNIKSVLYKNQLFTTYKNEYEVKKQVDTIRFTIGKNKYLCPSFETIVAYKENSAICHYTPTKSKNRKISHNSLLLIDSGGNYLYGTTDITRTISLYIDKIPDIVKKHYTLVLKSMLNLSMLRFPYGLTGSEIDIIARKYLYDEYLDFNHGTGHGIGYISNVHEGPNRIGPGISSIYEKNVLEPGQVTSNEPGLYFENKYGIRIENDLLTIKLKNNEHGDFLGFETLTLCPYDRDLIDKKYLDDKTITFLNKYNKLVYNKLSKYLTSDERKWLKKETREV